MSVYLLSSQNRFLKMLLLVDRCSYKELLPSEISGSKNKNRDRNRRIPNKANIEAGKN